jgi:hypothetical protein
MPRSGKKILEPENNKDIRDYLRRVGNKRKRIVSSDEDDGAKHANGSAREVLTSTAVIRSDVAAPTGVVIVASNEVNTVALASVRATGVECIDVSSTSPHPDDRIDEDDRPILSPIAGSRVLPSSTLSTVKQKPSLLSPQSQHRRDSFSSSPSHSQHRASVKKSVRKRRNASVMIDVIVWFVVEHVMHMDRLMMMAVSWTESRDLKTKQWKTTIKMMKMIMTTQTMMLMVKTKVTNTMMHVMRMVRSNILMMKMKITTLIRVLVTQLQKHAWLCETAAISRYSMFNQQFYFFTILTCYIGISKCLYFMR